MHPKMLASRLKPGLAASVPFQSKRTPGSPICNSIAHAMSRRIERRACQTATNLAGVTPRIFPGFPNLALASAEMQPAAPRCQIGCREKRRPAEVLDKWMVSTGIQKPPRPLRRLDAWAVTPRPGHRPPVRTTQFAAPWWGLRSQQAATAVKPRHAREGLAIVGADVAPAKLAACVLVGATPALFMSRIVGQASCLSNGTGWKPVPLRSGHIGSWPQCMF
jgi:hypothetical protein